MEEFNLNINGEEYKVKQGLHDNFYSVSCKNKSTMLGKNEEGKWVSSMQTSEAITIPAEEIGKAIEAHQLNESTS